MEQDIGGGWKSEVESWKLGKKPSFGAVFLLKGGRR